MSPEITKVATITYKGQVWILAKDVATIIEEFGAVEETDVRNRAKQLANNVRKLKPSP